MKLRKGDTVQMIAGKDKGKTGKIIEVDPCVHKIRVEGIALAKRHQKPNQKQKQGGIFEKEAWVQSSNAMFYDTKAATPTRIGYRLDKKGNKERVSKRSGGVI